MHPVLSGFRLERASSEANCIFAQSLDQGPSHLTKPALSASQIQSSCHKKYQQENCKSLQI
jgi:hypothetical protein